jgi:hypothetical protein
MCKVPTKMEFSISEAGIEPVGDDHRLQSEQSMLMRIIVVYIFPEQ